MQYFPIDTSTRNDCIEVTAPVALEAKGIMAAIREVKAMIEAGEVADHGAICWDSDRVERVIRLTTVSKGQPRYETMKRSATSHFAIGLYTSAIKRYRQTQ